MAGAENPLLVSIWHMLRERLSEDWQGSVPLRLTCWMSVLGGLCPSRGTLGNPAATCSTEITCTLPGINSSTQQSMAYESETRMQLYDRTPHSGQIHLDDMRH